MYTPKAKLYEPYAVFFETWHECPIRDHSHHFFELIYIVSGTGRHQVNDHIFSYQPGNLFLITPHAAHRFEVETVTQFFFLRFSDIYVKNSVLQQERIKQLEYILYHASDRPGCLLNNKSDRGSVHMLIQSMGYEVRNNHFYKKEVIQQYVNTLIILIARDIANHLPTRVSENTDDRAVAILTYIQNHICEPEKIRTESICEHFGISANYLGRYFKKQCGETMQTYITKYKAVLIAHRLKHSDRRIYEIAMEFGFTDESHLNKFFRRQHGLSPNQYRKKELAKYALSK